MQLKRIKALIIKEFLAVWQDKKSRSLLFLPPFMQLFVFAWAATLDVNNVPIAILNLDEGKWGYELAQRFVGSPTFTDTIFLESANQIPDTINNQKAFMVVHINKLFSQNLINGEKAEVQLILDGRKSNTTQVIQGYSANILASFSNEVNQFYGRPLPQAELIVRNWFNPNLIYTWFTVTGLVVVLTTLISVMITSLTVSREREMGTFEQLLVSPLLPIEILVGKMIPPIGIALFEGSVMVTAALVIFGIPLTGSLLWLYVTMFIFILAAAGAGLFISSICNTQQQTLLGVFVFLSPAIILSGYATPIDNMPIWMQYVTYLNPLRYFIYVSRGVFMREFTGSDVILHLVPLALMAAVTLTLATLSFRRSTSNA